MTSPRGRRPRSWGSNSSSWSNGTAVSNANVTAYNVSGDLQFSVLTDSGGNIAQQIVTAYFNNGSQVFDYNNYSINASINPTTTNSLNFTKETNVNDVIITWDNSDLRLTLITNTYPSVEIWQAERNAAPLMAAAFDREVRLDSFAPPIEHPIFFEKEDTSSEVTAKG